MNFERLMESHFSRLKVGEERVHLAMRPDTNTGIPVTCSVIVLSVTVFFMVPEAAAYRINRLGDACLRIQQWLPHDSGAGGT